MSSILDRKKAAPKKESAVDQTFGAGGMFTASSQETRRCVFGWAWIGRDSDLDWVLCVSMCVHQAMRGWVEPPPVPRLCTYGDALNICRQHTN